ncbi:MULTISPECIES: TetR/AcrR family transcriptional regulator [Dickeya]|uniref:Transcriptional regulator, TetR family n=1 Tax=Dickeya aquatica TaxID=1401087 RepID=A0A375A5B7_9GAMM|nr:MULTISPECIES: TetR family transcriptional regulator [Dickeya]SLM61274.1 Transcriptional regulator, TetR family [Dickeya aquatica]
MVNDQKPRLQPASRAKSAQTKERILEAASEIIRHDGLHACTQRAIAAELNISPGTITWHFRMLDDLHDAVIRNAVENFKSQTLTWFSECPPDKPEVQLTRFLCWTIQQQARLLREYELFVAAVARPRLRESAMAWVKTHSVIVQERFRMNAKQADAVVAYTDAWLLRSLLSEGTEQPDERMTERVFLSIIQTP